MEFIPLCIIAALAVIVFYAVAASTKTLFGNATYPLAAAATLLGIIGLFQGSPPQKTSWIAAILIPYEALFISVVCFVVVLFCIRVWNKISTSQHTDEWSADQRRRCENHRTKPTQTHRRQEHDTE